MIRKLLVLIVLVAVGVIAVPLVSATNVNLNFTCKYEVEDNPGVWRDCDNSASGTPKIQVIAGAVSTTVTMPTVVSVPINTTGELHVTNAWFFGCTYNTNWWNWNPFYIFTSDITVPFTYTCPLAYDRVQLEWQPFSGDEHFYGPEHQFGVTISNTTTHTGYTMTTPGDEIGTDSTGMGEGNSAYVWGIQRLEPGLYQIDGYMVTEKPECWVDWSGTGGYTHYTTYTYLDVEDGGWTQHTFDTMRFYRSNAPACAGEPTHD